MSTVVDLDGSIFSVPWHLVQYARRFRFFLRWFTCAGTLLHWGEHYSILLEGEDEISSDEWETMSYPGMLLKLQTRPGLSIGRCLENLAHDLVALAASCGVCLFTGSTEFTERHLCNLIGANVAEDLAFAVKHAIAVIRRDNVGGRVSVQQGRRIDRTCLLCLTAFDADLRLAEHIRTHLKRLRCQLECEQCDELGLPSCIAELVSNE